MKQGIWLVLMVISTSLVAAPRMTGFDPQRHGFQFVNDFQNDFISELDIRTGGLCGGMVYTALDYYLAGKAVPRQDFRPAVHTPLHDYMYDRQVHSIADNVDKWTELGFNPLGARNGEFFNWGLQGFNGGRLQELRESIDRNRPVPLGLWHYEGFRGGEHQVLAIGYDMGRYQGRLGDYQGDFKIFVYDPNHPGVTKTLSVDTSSHSYYYADGNERWLTYFVDRKYRAKTPPNVASPARANNGKMRRLRLTIGTGSDDLRGGNDNLDVEVVFSDNSKKLLRNVNGSRRWIGNYQQTVEQDLGREIDPSMIRRVVLRTHFSGGFNSDNWNMNFLRIDGIVNGAAHKLYERYDEGRTIQRFTGEVHEFVAPINDTVVMPNLPITVNKPIVIAGNACHQAAQGKVAWDYQGSTQWAQGNLDKLCAFNNRTAEPAKCFQTVMHGGVDWGGGTRWQWGNALKLCAGTQNAAQTVNCFKQKRGQGQGWSDAIEQCRRR